MKFKIGDKIRFVPVGKLRENYKKYGEPAFSPDDIKKQRKYQCIVDTITGFESMKYVYLKNTGYDDYFFIGRLEKIDNNSIINLDDGLFEL